MSYEQTPNETMSAAYDQGVEDGIQQERERIREALLSDETLNATRDAFLQAAYRRDVEDPGVAVPDPFDEMLDALSDHIGLGEESEK